jgi:hypothetical protein
VIAAFFLSLAFGATFIGLVLLGVLNFLLVSGACFLSLGILFDRNPQIYVYSSPAIRFKWMKVKLYEKELKEEVTKRNKSLARTFLSLGIYALTTWFFYTFLSLE